MKKPKATVTYCPCPEPVGDYLGTVPGMPGLKARGKTKQEAWDLIIEIRNDVVDSDYHLDLVEKKRLKGESHDQ